VADFYREREHQIWRCTSDGMMSIVAIVLNLDYKRLSVAFCWCKKSIIPKMCNASNLNRWWVDISGGTQTEPVHSPATPQHCLPARAILHASPDAPGYQLQVSAHNLTGAPLLGFETSRLGFWTSRLGFWTSRLGFWTSRLGFETSGLGFWTSRLGFWTSRLRF